MKCINCDKKIKSSDTYCSNCGINLKNIEVINDDIKKKNNTIFYLVIFFLFLIGTSVSIWLFIRNDSKENKENRIDVIIDEDKEILFKDYILTIPEGFTKKDSYIKNNNLIISYKEYPLSYEDIKNNKELLNNSLEEQGYVINKDDIRKIDDKEYLVILANKDDIDYGLVFYEFDNDTNIFISITSNYLSNFKEDWFNPAIDLIKSSKKI